MDYEVLDVDSNSPKVEQHLMRVAEGVYRLPEFQRTFVWDQYRILRLWDSLYRGFPVGQLMLWEPEEVDFPMRALGRTQAEVQAKRRGQAVIDGQQRLTALYLVLTGDTPLRFDLAAETFTYTDGPNVLRLDILRDATGAPVSFKDAAGRQFFYTHASEAQKSSFGSSINHLNGVMTQRELPSQTIKGATYPTVLGVFKRLNQQGAPLNEAQLTMSEISRHWPGVFRRTYDLLKRMNTEMGYAETDDPTFVFLVWTAVHTAQHLVKHLAPEEEIRSKYQKLADRQHYESSWEKTASGISKLIDVMRNDLDLTNFKFIKSQYPLAVVGHYLAMHPCPSQSDMDSLRRWLILAVVSGRYHERSQSKYSADIKATIGGQAIDKLFHHRREALDPITTMPHLISPEQLTQVNFRSAYVTLLYLVVRKLGATDWFQRNIRVGDPLASGTWHFHHIFADERFAGDRAKLRQSYEDALEEGDEAAIRRIEAEQKALEEKVFSLGNLAFLTPQTNISISNRAPQDYLKEIASTPEGRASLEAQLIPMSPELWRQSAFDAFCQRRCELLAAKAKELFFPGCM